MGMHTVNNLAARLENVRSSLEVDAHNRASILHFAQFTKHDIEQVARISPTQLHNWVSRDFITLSSEQNPGKGRRRMYNGYDAILVTLAAALQPFGMVTFADHMVQTCRVPARADQLVTWPIHHAEVGRRTKILPVPELSDFLIKDFVSDEPNWPGHAAVIIDLDRLIIETLERLLLIIQGEPLPEPNWPPRPSEQDVEDEHLDFTGQAYRDEEGNRIFRGLSIEESLEFDRLVKMPCADLTDYQADRLNELSRRNDAATGEFNRARSGASHA